MQDVAQAPPVQRPDHHDRRLVALRPSLSRKNRNKSGLFIRPRPYHLAVPVQDVHEASPLILTLCLRQQL
eukprot:1556911-Heterocapsa_arctica.AAC.1